ncbi:MAG: mannose-1-phosphate guanylyltransferase [Tannerella sp.]|jgi:mannose-1-phosphate guanylyltransferase|nr:mannose-1-phosphate guanylyltransferase [Tannerella sp.]
MKDDYCVIMGGGIGSRFWPFSRENFPKQFLDFFGVGQSLLQMTVDRFAKIIPVEHIYVVTNERYAGLVREQLPQLRDSQILLEPTRRNTAPCIAYAAYHIRACNPAANIVVAPSDHLILKEGEFLTAISEGLDFIRKNEALLTLGIKPSRPETGYGYIQSTGKITDQFAKVKTFTEKPDAELAEVFMNSGEFFWNSGIFLWNINAIINAFRMFLPEISARFDLGEDKFGTPDEQDFINTNYPYCPNISIDYGIMEKADNVYMQCVDFGWADLGTWGSLFDIAPRDEGNNAVLNNTRAMLYGCENNIVSLGDRTRLAVIQGLKDYIVAENGNVLMICPKEDEHRVKQYIADSYLKYKGEFS